MQFGYIRVVTGPNASRFPACTSLVVDDGETVAVIDPGAGPAALSGLTGGLKADVVINTHYHFDHISGNYLFPQAKVYLNPIEVDAFSDLSLVPAWMGVKEVYGDEGVAAWLKVIADPDSPQTAYSPAHRHEWWRSTRVPAASYAFDTAWHIGKTKVIMVHTPGHTRGFCCPYFPDEGVVYTGDIDLTSFGPFYFGSDGDIEQFLLSARRVARLDADWFVTGHHMGTVSRSDFLLKLEQFVDVIYKRQDRIIALREAGIRPEDMPGHGFVYPPRYQADPWIGMWEKLALRKHGEFLDKPLPVLR